jgi:Flp pilus assembly protein TadG
MAIEVVILAPILIMFIMIVVAFGRYVVVRGDVEAASRDAVRAASFERDPGSAINAASQTAQATLTKWTCTPTAMGGQFQAGGVISVTLSCQVPYGDLGLIGLPGSITVTATSDAPLDLYRRTGP